MHQITPILAALKRHKAGTTLLALQIALTLAIICNALFIIEQRITHMSRPTGMVENNLLTIRNHWVGVTPNDVAPQIKSDLLALRQLPGVQDATQVNSFPLLDAGHSDDINLDPNSKSAVTNAAIYFVDEHAIPTMGAKLIAGRNFHSDEVRSLDPKAIQSSPQVILTKALADKLYPDGSALGKTLYVGNNVPASTVVGIVERLQIPWNGSWADNISEYTLLMPIQRTGNDGVYLIRSKPGQLPDVTKSASAALIKLSRMRVVNDNDIRTFDVVREQAYKNDRGMALLMGVICIVLLAITAAGIVGLTSFWVGQRRKQIGVRRALGATKSDILSYFLTENFLIGIGGVVVGAALAILLNLWMMSQFQMNRLSLSYVLAGMVVLLLLGQGAVLSLAFRASRVSPVEAIRRLNN